MRNLKKRTHQTHSMLRIILPVLASCLLTLSSIPTPALAQMADELTAEESVEEPAQEAQVQDTNESQPKDQDSAFAGDNEQQSMDAPKDQESVDVQENADVQQNADVPS